LRSREDESSGEDMSDYDHVVFHHVYQFTTGYANVTPLILAWAFIRATNSQLPEVAGQPPPKFTKLFWLIDIQISAEISATRRRTQCHRQTRLSALSSISPHATVFPSFLTQSALRYTPSTLGEDVLYSLSLPSQPIVEKLKTGLPVYRSHITLLLGYEAQENPWNSVTLGRHSRYTHL
jgi:hypothetical protein